MSLWWTGVSTPNINSSSILKCSHKQHHIYPHMRYIWWVGSLPHSMGMADCPSLLHFYPLWVLHLLRNFIFATWLFSLSSFLHGIPRGSVVTLLMSSGVRHSEPSSYNSGMDSAVWSEGMSKFLSHLIIIPCEFFEKPHPLVCYKDFNHLGLLFYPHSVCGFSPIKPPCHLTYEAWGGNERFDTRILNSGENRVSFVCNLPPTVVISTSF